MTNLIRVSYAIISIVLIYFAVKNEWPFILILSPLILLGIAMFIMMNYSQNALQKYKVKNISKEIFNKIFQQLPFEIQAIKNLDFILFDHFDVVLPIVKITVLVYKKIENNIFFTIYRYDNKNTYAFYITYFDDKSTLITSRDAAIIKSTFGDSNIQYFPNSSNKELLNIQKEAITYIESKTKVQPIDFETPEIFRENFVKKEKEYYLTLGSFAYFKILKNKRMRDVAKYQQKLQYQHSG